MRLSEKCSKIIYKRFLGHKLRYMEQNGLEAVLSRSLETLDDQALGELRTFVNAQHHPEGGFVDRAGRPDLYYTLFGYWVALTVGLPISEPLRLKVKQWAGDKSLKGVHCACIAILYAQLWGQDATTRQLHRNLRRQMIESGDKQPEYGIFIQMLALYYLGDYPGLFRLIRQIDPSAVNEVLPKPFRFMNAVIEKVFGDNPRKKLFVGSIENLPLPLLSAMLMMKTLASPSSETTRIEQAIVRLHRAQSGFAALFHAPDADLLSTAVASYALRFAGYDLRLLKPDLLAFVDDCYEDGGFKSIWFDSHPDIEYTFYGLLALGSLTGQANRLNLKKHD